MTDKWVRDTGLVFALLFLVLGFRGNKLFLCFSILFLVCVLFVPVVIRPLAFVWMKLAEVLGQVMNKVFFGLIFFLVVTPVGLLKRLFGEDERDLVKDTSRASAFYAGKGRIIKTVFEKPY